MVKIEEIEQKLNECQKALAELKESKKEKWKPKAYDKYYVRHLDGDIIGLNWLDGDDSSEKIYKHTPTFKTREECEKYWHFRDTVKEKSYTFSREEWEDRNTPKYYFYYVPISNDFVITYQLSQKDFGGIYFKTHADAKYIIDNFKEELLKYWL